MTADPAVSSDGVIEPDLSVDADADLAAVDRRHTVGSGRRLSNSRSFSALPGGLADWRTPSTSAGDSGLLRDTRILIVDDSTLCREFLAGVVTAHGVLAPGLAWDVPSLTAALESTLPRVVLLNMATRNKAVLLRHALEFSPSARVVVLGVSETDESEIVACAEAGVAGYHLRNESLDDLLILIHNVAAGESLCSPRISAILLRRLSALASQRQPAVRELVLTSREAQILRMLESGLSNRDIAAELCIAVHTVKNHVHSLLNKLGVSSRAQAAALARTILHADSAPGDQSGI
ncbi:LuxR C-terminal-related transcriptional regulator [Mycobacterium sp. NPDC004974]